MKFYKRNRTSINQYLSQAESCLVRTVRTRFNHDHNHANSSHETDLTFSLLFTPCKCLQVICRIVPNLILTKPLMIQKSKSVNCGNLLCHILTSWSRIWLSCFRILWFHTLRSQFWGRRSCFLCLEVSLDQRRHLFPMCFNLMIALDEISIIPVWLYFESNQS